MSGPKPTGATATVTTWLPLPDTGVAADLLAMLPAGYEELRSLYASLWDLDIDAVTLELCRLRLATLIGSRADLAVRDPRAVAAGLDEAQVAALPAWPSSPLFSDQQRAGLGFVEQYVIDAHGITDEQAAAMHAHFTPQQLATLTIAMATFDALARVRALLSTDGSPSALPTHDADVGVALT
jgi:alkylhydroperoxidase family enzyme